MITGLTIKRFKCFEDFHIANLAPVTILGGKNNVGKSSLLEAIWVQNAMLNANCFVFLMNLHNEVFLQNTQPGRVWDPLFFNGAQSDCFEIDYERAGEPDRSGDESAPETGALPKADKGGPGQNEQTQNSGKAVLKVSKNYGEYEIYKNSTSGFTPAPGYNLNFAGQRPYFSVQLELKGRGYENSGRCSINANSIVFTPDLRDREVQSGRNTGGVQLMPLWPYENITLFKNITGNSYNSVAEWISKLNLVKEKEDMVLETMRLFDPEIISIAPVIDQGVSSVYVRLKSSQGAEKVISANYMGDGFNKVFQLLLTVLMMPDGILLIDEFENGLHYEIYEEVLTKLFTVADRVHCQIIMTSHSRDLIETAQSVMKKLNLSDKLCYQRLELDHSRHKTVVYQGAELELPFKANLEIR